MNPHKIDFFPNATLNFYSGGRWRLTSPGECTEAVCINWLELPCRARRSRHLSMIQQLVLYSLCRPGSSRLVGMRRQFLQTRAAARGIDDVKDGDMRKVQLFNTGTSKHLRLSPSCRREFAEKLSSGKEMYTFVIYNDAFNRGTISAEVEHTTGRPRKGRCAKKQIARRREYPVQISNSNR